MIGKLNKKIYPLIALSLYVFWLLSLPMSGFLLDKNSDKYSLLFFLIPHIVGFFLISKLSNLFENLSIYACFVLASLTLVYPFLSAFQKIILILIGFLSVFPALKSIILFQNTNKKIIFSTFALVIGNLLTFITNNLFSTSFFSFLLISLSILIIGFLKNYPETNSNIGKISTKLHLLIIFTFYLTGGTMYGWFLPKYVENAYLNGYELLFYILSTLLGLFIIKKDLEITFALGILLSGFSFLLYKIENPLYINLGMFASQSAFGLADIFIVNLMIQCFYDLKKLSHIYMTMLSGILMGNILSIFFENKVALIIETGNFFLIISALMLFGLNKFPSYSYPNVSVATEPLPENNKKDITSYFKNKLLEKLSEQEKKVLELILKDKNYSEISEALGISISSVKTYMRRIYEKTNTHTKEELINKIFKE